jgi:xanthine phosphoribosyltransferase
LNKLPIKAQQEFTDSFTVSPSTLRELSRSLAACIRTNHKGPIKALVAVTRGGLSITEDVSTELNIRFIDTVGVKNYNDNDKPLTKPIIFKKPLDELCGEGSRGVIVIDDLVDSGKSVDAILELMPHAEVAVVHAKPEGRDRANYYVDDVPQKTWVYYPRDTMLQRK